MFPRHDGPGRIENKDYTKFIKWTPLRVAIATLILFTPYAALVYAVASATSIMAVVPMLIAPALIAIFAGIIYWLSKAVL
ncbi:hypothetical protein H6F67_03855 [Microcoleus sp. FACHB-1515]|uniref:hypothetical protein n=1 Tax=Cyanophyceae TaxID=3028117 RepID=UPI001682EFFB|nr:hypothetical protein [Microcoleus sp. FACHB-1515]MBD2088987.1 hypothetical protein [Microcoleus sp. FACHB-1515]